MRLLTFCVDDGLRVTYENLLKIFRKKNYKATWAVCSNISKLQNYELIGKQEQRFLVSLGHELVDHGDKHLPINLDNIKTRKTTGSFYVYPDGKECNDLACKRHISKFFWGARGNDEGFNKFENIDWFNLKTLFLANKGQHAIETIDVAKFINSIQEYEWLIITMHLVSDKWSDYKHSYSLENFKKIISVIPKNIKVVTMSEAYLLWEEYYQ